MDTPENDPNPIPETLPQAARKNPAALIIILAVVALAIAGGAVFLLMRDSGPYTLQGSITLGPITKDGPPCSGALPGGVRVDMIGEDGKSAGSGSGGNLKPDGTDCVVPFSFEIEKSSNYQMRAENPQDPNQLAVGPKFTLDQLKEQDFKVKVDGNSFQASPGSQTGSASPAPSPAGG